MLPFESALLALFRDGEAQRTVVERPPDGVGRGLFAAPPAVVIAVASALVAVTLVYLVKRARRR